MSERLTESQRAVLRLLIHEQSPLTAREVGEWVGGSPSVLRSLAARGFVEHNANYYWAITKRGIAAADWPAGVSGTTPEDPADDV